MDSTMMVRARGRLYTTDQAKRSLIPADKFFAVSLAGSIAPVILSLVFVRGDMSFGLVALFIATLFSVFTVAMNAKKDPGDIGDDIESLKAHNSAKLLKMKNELYIFGGASLLIIVLSIILASPAVVLSLLTWFVPAGMMVMECLKMHDIASGDAKLVQVLAPNAGE